MSTDIIKLNGRSYNASTGKIIGEGPFHQQVTAALTKHSISDIVEATHPATTLAAAPQAQLRKTLHTTKKSDRTPSHLKAHHQQPAKTLARFAVKQPAAATKARHVQTAVDSSVKLHKSHPPVKPSRSINAARLQRAAQAQHSHLVQRFNKAAEPLRPKLQALSVQPTKQSAVSARQATAKSHERRVETVLRHATSHQHAAVRYSKKRFSRVSNRFIAISVAILAVILVGVFVLSQNLPQIDVRLASIRAGFPLVLPSYQPAGFAFMSHVAVDPGKATLVYHSTSDSREFSITQQTSNWNSETLQAFVASTAQPLQAWPDKGHTVYLYGNHLTWVTQGVWYQITNHADLSSTQLLNIATSM